MPTYQVRYTSGPIEADSPEQAIEIEGKGGGEWEAVLIDGEQDEQTNTFDANTLDDESRATYERRFDIGKQGLAIIDQDEPETDASDLISDVLTYLYGPCGTYSTDFGTYNHRPEADERAQALLRRALESWQGDAEDYGEKAEDDR